MQSYMMPSDDTTSYPPPDPPVILPPENSTITSQSSFLSQAPYFPFLSHAPPPENSWIEVETLQHEYKLHVRLPGFTREGITLATKKRRILHVVANKWENGGGK
jgi:HSP20 family molecular chaperone IbpA